MEWVRPKVTLIAGTGLSFNRIEEWLKSLDVSQEGVDAIWDRYENGATPVVHPERITAPEMLVALAAKRCYKSFEAGLNPNVEKVSEDYEKYLQNSILKVGHGSVLEHSSFSFAIENVSRVFTAEMNRHRAGMAISEQSLRFVRFNDIPIVEVPSLRDTDDPRTVAIRSVIEATVTAIEEQYERLVEITCIREARDFKHKKEYTSLVRRIIPLGVATGGVWTGNLRALRHIITMRAAPEAEEEIREVAQFMLEALREEAPTIFGDFDVQGTPQFKKV